MNSQIEEAKRFVGLHRNASRDARALLMPDPWGSGLAKVLESLGFRTRVTPSGACADPDTLRVLKSYQPTKLTQARVSSLAPNDGIVLHSLISGLERALSREGRGLRLLFRKAVPHINIPQL